MTEHDDMRETIDLVPAVWMHRARKAEAEIERLIEAHKREVGQLVTRASDLELWIDSVGRTCPSNDTISDFLLGQEN